jgi:hypothetical protein
LAETEDLRRVIRDHKASGAGPPSPDLIERISLWVYDVRSLLDALDRRDNG